MIKVFASRIKGRPGILLPATPIFPLLTFSMGIFCAVIIFAVLLGAVPVWAATAPEQVVNVEAANAAAGKPSSMPSTVPTSSHSMSLPTNLIKVPRLRQSTDYTCGVCALQAVLGYYGDDVREDELARMLKANHTDGTRYKEIAKYGQSHGYNVEIKKDAEVADLEAFLTSGRPVICLIQAWGEDKSGDGQKIDYSKRWQDGHYVVAVGFDKDNIYFMDPSTVGTYTYIGQ